MKYRYSLRTLLIVAIVAPALVAIVVWSVAWLLGNGVSIREPDPFSTMLALAVLLVALPAVAIFSMILLFVLTLRFLNSELRACPNCKKLVSKRGGFCPSYYCPLPPT